jgi:hypothetical protein
VSIIEKYFINNYKIDDVSLPCALCLTCQKVLFEYGRGIFNRKIELLDYSKKNTFPRPMTRHNEDCQCDICKCTVVLYIRVPGTMLLLLSTRAYLGPGIRDEGHSFQVTRQRNIKINCKNKPVEPRASRIHFPLQSANRGLTARLVDQMQFLQGEQQ